MKWGLPTPRIRDRGIGILVWLLAAAVATAAVPAPVAASGASNLRSAVERARARSGAPAVAAAIVRRGTITEVAVVGERWVGSGQAVERADAFHIGSITKSMTATMIAALVQKELLAWDITVGDILFDMDMLAEYRDVTLEELLQHRGGFAPYRYVDEKGEKRLPSFRGGATLQREAFVSEVLMSQPEVTPHARMHYSNAGYVVATYMAERVSARSWEELIREQLFDVSGMKSAGFGWPATPAQPGQPWGHYVEADTLRPQEPGDYGVPAYLAPAGDVHCSIEDLARYAILHLRGLAGRDKVFDANTIRRLHAAPPAPRDEIRYAAGWAIVESADVGEVHTHSGSAGTFFATIELYPQYQAALVLATNVGPKKGVAVSEEITTFVRGRIAQEGPR
jgi:CubicO group peptidase (beta-lactamase class C family)